MSPRPDASEHVHADGRIARAGAAPVPGGRAVILVHGRGASPESILSLSEDLPGELGFAFVAPGASETSADPRSWYPLSFLAPVEHNEPALSSALARIGEVVADLARDGIVSESIILLGFSQGACLCAEYAARSGRRWGGIAILTGGLVGDELATREYAGDLAGTPAFLGTSDRDPHVPLWRVEETAEVLRQLGAAVEMRVYPLLPHTIVRDELEWVAATMRDLASR